jgi:ribosomal-protein-alanine N-acetyltransferase
VSTPVVTTPRLLLREWRPEDREPFAAMNADPRVMQHFPGVLSRRQSDALARGSAQHFERHGFGPWAVEVPGVAPFIGFVGLDVPGFEAHFTPCVEVGWRLAHDAWGQGFATEGAEACLAHAFTVLTLAEVVSMTTVRNARSRAVMERLGMHTDPADDFEHPRVPAGNAVRPHVLYRITAEEWRGRHRDAVD